MILAIIPSVYVSKKDNFLSVLLKSSVLIPLFFPAVSTVMVFSIIGNFKLMEQLNFLYTLKAIVVANVFYNMPLFVKFAGESLEKIPYSIIEYSRTEGCGKFEIFFKIKLPLIYPALMKAFFLCLVFCFTNMAIILGLGGINYSTLEVEIATTLSGSMSYSSAFGYGLIQLIFLSAFNVLISSCKVYEFDDYCHVKEKVSLIETAYSVMYLLIEFSIVGLGVIFAFYNFYTGDFELFPIIKIFSVEFNRTYPVIQSLLNSFVISFTTALIVTVFTFILLKNTCRYTNAVILSTCGISSAFLGIVLVYLNISLDIPYFMLALTGYFLITVPFSFSFLYQPVLSFPKSLIEAAKIDGCSPLKIFIYVELPLLLPIFISSFLLIFAICFGEFTIAYTMQLINYLPTVPVVNYSMLSRRLFSESSALNGLNIVIVLSVFIIGEYLRKKLSFYH
ncbi:MAG: ABC transporter permease subunit [Victivallales bacterium]|nr:ABC transporter permease subunit [Victivallales bacterium]